MERRYRMMASSSVKAKFVVDESGRKSAVQVSIRDFRRLMDAWEEVNDAKDFAVAKKTSKKLISVAELKHRVLSDR
jgi:hypothetical protein